LAVFQILGIQHDGKDIQSLPPLHLVEPNIRIQEVMKLGLIGQQDGHQGSAGDHDWK
jgi:hypothetical protein